MVNEGRKKHIWGLNSRVRDWRQAWCQTVVSRTRVKNTANKQIKTKSPTSKDWGSLWCNEQMNRSARCCFTNKSALETHAYTCTESFHSSSSTDVLINILTPLLHWLKTWPLHLSVYNADVCLVLTSARQHEDLHLTTPVSAGRAREGARSTNVSIWQKLEKKKKKVKGPEK